MEERMIFAGAGGQGMMLLGKLMAYAAMKEELNVTWFPSYGAEVRGGTAHCHIVVSSGPVYSPLVEEASSMIVMNEPSLARFAPRLAKGGLLILNTSLADEPEHSNGPVIAVPATDIANQLGNIRVANMVMLAALNAARSVVKSDTLWAAVEDYAGEARANLLEVNRRAFDKGLEYGRAKA